MFELVIASGKGGTGKTSLTGALAQLAGRAVLVDCDVDAADLHLIIPHKVNGEHDFLSSRKAAIDTELCDACGTCQEYCRFNSIKIKRDSQLPPGMRFEVDPLACEGCGLCVHLCPTGAIRFDRVVSGRWFQSESEHGPFLHARLGLAQSNSGRLVSLLRQRARQIAEKSEIDLVIVDGPPGIGCPTIAALTDASYLLIVTEPSLSAIHDMERLADLAAHFEIPTGICINKYDISEEISRRAEKFAAERDLTIHGKIPYDKAFTDAQLQGRSYLTTGSLEGIERIRKLWRSVRADAVARNQNNKRRFAI